MSEINIRPFDCDDDCEGERGKRGKRGHRGHDGDTGPMGPQGPAGPEAGALLGRQVFNTAGNDTYTPTLGTRTAIVRGCGGGGGGGGSSPTGPNNTDAASGGNSGVAIEIEVSAPPNTFLTGGAFTVGAGAPGQINSGPIQNGGDSTLVIGGVLLTAPGGAGGSAGIGAIPPAITPSSFQPPSPTPGIDYQAADLGQQGFALSTTAVQGGDGGSGDYGIGGAGRTGLGSGADATGNGAGGGGAAATANSPTVLNGGSGASGLWIIEEYS